MAFSFKNILIPIDLDLNSYVAVTKAVELADQSAKISLLRMQKPQRFFEVGNDSGTREDIQALLEQKIEDAQKDIVVTNKWLSGSNIQQQVEHFARRNEADLIVIGRNRSHTWFPFLNRIIPTKLAEKTGIAVLTVRPAVSCDQHVKTMVVPITGETYAHKMEIISAIRAKLRVRVFLVTFIEGDVENIEFSGSPLLKAYQWLKSVHCPVEYSLLQGYNKARAILKYVEKVNADILLVKPESETRIGWPGKHISDVLPQTSKVQVWTV